MDHMRISGNEPSSVILSQTKWFQTLKMIARKCQIKLNPKGMVTSHKVTDIKGPLYISTVVLVSCWDWEREQ